MATAGIVLGYFGVYYPITVLPSVGVLTGLLMWLWHTAAPDVVDPDDNGLALLVGILGIGVAVALHAKFSGNFLYITRDPAFYNLLGLDLARTGDLVFDGASQALEGVPGVRHASQNVVLNGDQSAAYAQGFHGTEAVLAPTEWIGGLWLYLKATALLGGVALIALRRVAVRFGSPWIATIATGALAVSVPFAEFTRNPYSEVLVLVCVLGALLVLLECPTGPRSMFVASFVVGAAMTARIDALLVISGVAMTVLLLPLVIERRWIRPAELAGVAVGFLVPISVGLYIGRNRSPLYFSGESGNMRTQVLLVLAVLAGIGGLYLVRMVISRTGWDLHWLGTSLVARAGALGVLVAGFAYWFVVPALLDFRRSRDTPGLVGLQAREGLAPDARRIYGEESLRRLEMNFGTLLVLFAIIGGALAVYSILRQRDRRAWVLLVTAMPAVPYLVLPRITPDMPWAMRRFLPVVIPVMLVLAVIGLERLRVALRSHPAGFAFALAVALAGPAVGLAPVVSVRGEAESLGYTEAICRELPPDATVFVSDLWMTLTGLQTIDQICGIDAVAAANGFTGSEVVVDVAEAVEEAGGSLVMLTQVGGEVPDGLREVSRQNVSARIENVMRTLEKMPTGAETAVRTVDVVRVEVDG